MVTKRHYHLTADGVLTLRSDKSLWDHNWQGENGGPCGPPYAGVAYLGGKMRGVPYWNRDAFVAAAADLRFKGWTIHSPFEHDLAEGLEPPEDGGDPPDLTNQLEWDFARIAESSCMILLPGWETSQGVHWELTVAYALRKAVFQYPEMTPVDMPWVVTNPTACDVAFDRDVPVLDAGTMRTFGTGATRHNDEDKLDYEGFLSPAALRLYAEYLHKNRRQADGQLRDSDNWQKGIPRSVYMKSAWRHFMAAWTKHRAGEDPTEDFCGVLFNVMGYLHEQDKADDR